MVEDVRIKQEIEELFFKPIIVSLDDTHKFQQEEMKKIRLIKNTRYDWLINICDPIRKSLCGIKDKIIKILSLMPPKLFLIGSITNIN